MIGMGFGRCWPFGELAPLWFGGSLQGLQVGVQPFLLAGPVGRVYTGELRSWAG